MDAAPCAFAMFFLQTGGDRRPRLEAPEGARFAAVAAIRAAILVRSDKPSPRWVRRRATFSDRSLDASGRPAFDRVAVAAFRALANHLNAPLHARRLRRKILLR
jgi:uncharacterized protein (UPF0147 family)